MDDVRRGGREREMEDVRREDEGGGGGGGGGREGKERNVNTSTIFYNHILLPYH